MSDEEITIAPLAIHLERFREAIFAIEGHCLDYSSSGSLLQFASGIRGIEYSEAGMYCRGIANYERQEESALIPFLTAQSIFMLSWMVLENFIDELKPKNISSLGKIGALCAHLKNNSNLFDIPYGYSEFVKEWITIEQSFDASYRSRKSLPQHLDKAGEGVYRVYCLRNHLFHGDFSGFDPSDEMWDIYTQSLHLGTRLTVLTIQMVLMIAFHNAKFMETSWHSSLFLDKDEVSIREGFGKLHIEDI